MPGAGGCVCRRESQLFVQNGRVRPPTEIGGGVDCGAKRERGNFAENESNLDECGVAPIKVWGNDRNA